MWNILVYFRLLYQLLKYRKGILFILKVMNLFILIRKYKQITYEYYEDWIIVNK